MKLLWTLMLTICYIAVFSQKPCTLFDKYISAGERIMKEKANEDYFKAAIDSFSVAMIHCPEKSDKAREKILEVFDEIEKLRKRALYLAKIAEQEKIKANNARDSILNLYNQIDSLAKIKDVAEARLEDEAKALNDIFENALIYTLKIFKKPSDSWIKEEKWKTELEAFEINKKNIDRLPYQLFEMENLKTLFLTSNQLDTLPPEIAKFKKLEELYLRDNNFKNFPETIFKLEELTTLDISSNSLENIPPGIQALKKLSTLRLSFNQQLSKLPNSIGNLPSLEKLDLSYNNFSFLPIEIGNLKKLKSLKLSENNFQQFPTQILNFKKLEELDIANNKISSLPSNLSSWDSLKILNLKYNKLSFLPSQIGELTTLKELHLNGNLLDSIPEQIGNLSNLELLDLANNNLRRIPPGIFQLKKIKKIDLSENPLNQFSVQSFPIFQFEELEISTDKYVYNSTLNSTQIIMDRIDLLPDQFWEFENLTSLVINRYELKNISQNLHKVKNLKYLDIKQTNDLNYPAFWYALGAYPKELIISSKNSIRGSLNKRSVEYLHVAIDSYVRLPEQMWDLKNVKKLFLTQGQLGKIPEGLWNLKSLIELDLSSNKIEDISPQIRKLKNLQYLTLWHNSLESIPKGLDELDNLTTLNLSENNIKSIQGIGEIKNLQELSLSYNKIDNIDQTIGNLTKLKMLQLENNLITQIHPKLWSNKNLTKVDLQGNENLNLQKLFSDLAKSTLKRSIIISTDEYQYIPQETEDLYISLNPFESLPNAIGQIENLRELNLEGSQITTLPIQHLKQLKKLKKITLKGNPISDQEIKKIKTELPLCQIIF